MKLLLPWYLTDATGGEILGTVEARSGLVLGLTTATISFISYLTVMGIVGGGGVGDFAIRYGYQRFKKWRLWDL